VVFEIFRKEIFPSILTFCIFETQIAQRVPKRFRDMSSILNSFSDAKKILVSELYMKMSSELMTFDWILSEFF